MAIRATRLLAIIFAAALFYGAAGCAKPKVQLQVSRDRIQQGEDVRVSWTAKNAKQVTINGEAVGTVMLPTTLIPRNSTARASR